MNINELPPHASAWRNLISVILSWKKASHRRTQLVWLCNKDLSGQFSHLCQVFVQMSFFQWGLFHCPTLSCKPQPLTITLLSAPYSTLHFLFPEHLSTANNLNNLLTNCVQLLLSISSSCYCQSPPSRMLDPQQWNLFLLLIDINQVPRTVPGTK